MISGADPAKFKGQIQRPNSKGGFHTEVMRTKPQQESGKKSTSLNRRRDEWGGELFKGTKAILLL